MKKDIIIEICCSLFIFLFLYTGISKIANFEVFRIQLTKHALLKPFAGILAWAVPLLEIVIAVLLIPVITRRLAIYSFIVVMLLFTLYLTYMITLYEHLPCSCGGIIATLSWRQHAVLNVVFLLLGAACIKLLKKMPKGN